MPRLAYSARARDGKTVTADLDAPTRKDALRVLSARGLQVASVAELAAGAKPSAKNGSAPAPAAAKTTARASRRSAQPPRREECLPFLEALYDLLTSGLSA